MEKLIVQNIGKGLGDFFFIELEKNGTACVIMIDSHTVKNGYNQETKSQLGKYEKIDYLIITHIDTDHIKGIMKFWKDKKFQDKFRDTLIIYNFVTQNRVGYKEASEFEHMIKNHYVIQTDQYDYRDFSSAFVKILSFEKRKKFDVDNHYAYLTLLAPDKEGIRAVYEDYREKFRKAENDLSNIGQPKNHITNHNSIVFLLEFAGKKLLFMGDNDIGRIEPLLEGLKNINSNTKIDFIKIGHHGAWNENKNLVEFAKRHNCNQFLVTGKEQWDEKHPDKRIMDALCVSGIQDLYLYTKIDFDNALFPNIQISNKQEIILLD